MSHDQRKIIPDVEDLLKSLKVMTIAVPWENGVWSAPVYYLYKNRAFSFFSSADSRHIKGAKLSPDMEVAASIFMDDVKVNNIRGIQMRGKIYDIVATGNTARIDNADITGNITPVYNTTVADNTTTVADINRVGTSNTGEVLAYIKKFGISFKGLNDRKNWAQDALDLMQQHYRSSFYRFVPSEIIYMDNRVQIGFKQKIIL
ncbi:MAG: hypothetical protein HQK62_12365 [Desulfamplus sp.]|nr:hypothetical protein [Desulfamplus sp.]